MVTEEIQFRQYAGVPRRTWWRKIGRRKAKKRIGFCLGKRSYLASKQVRTHRDLHGEPILVGKLFGDGIW